MTKRSVCVWTYDCGSGVNAAQKDAEFFKADPLMTRQSRSSLPVVFHEGGELWRNLPKSGAYA